MLKTEKRGRKPLNRDDYYAATVRRTLSKLKASYGFTDVQMETHFAAAIRQSQHSAGATATQTPRSTKKALQRPTTTAQKDSSKRRWQRYRTGKISPSTFAAICRLARQEGKLLSTSPVVMKLLVDESSSEFVEANAIQTSTEPTKEEQRSTDNAEIQRKRALLASARLIAAAYKYIEASSAVTRADHRVLGDNVHLRALKVILEMLLVEFSVDRADFDRMLDEIYPSVQVYWDAFALEDDDASQDIAREIAEK